jgi:hypothetical protein
MSTMRLYLKLLTGDMIEFPLNMDMCSVKPYEKECKTHVLTCAPNKRITQSYKTYVDIATELGYTYDVHVRRNIKIQFIKTLRKIAADLRILLNQCCVFFMDHELFKNNLMVETVFADLVLSKKIVEDSVLCLCICPLHELGSVSMQDLLIYLEMNKYDLEEGAIVWITPVGDSLIAVSYKKDLKSLNFLTYHDKNNIPLEKCIDIAQNRLNYKL